MAGGWRRKPGVEVEPRAFVLNTLYSPGAGWEAWGAGLEACSRKPWRTGDWLGAVVPIEHLYRGYHSRASG